MSTVVQQDHDDLVMSQAILRRNLALMNIPPEDPGIPDWSPAPGVIRCSRFRSAHGE